MDKELIKKNIMDFTNICKMPQEKLKEWLPSQLISNGYTDIVSGDGYIYAKGSLPVLLTAHMDTVHNKICEKINFKLNNNKICISSPQGIGGDDRCGIYMILDITKELKPSVLFCEDEESGGIGSTKFCKTEFIKDLSNLNYLVELDRANAKDAVFYNCDNEDFTDFITSTTGYKEAYGSFSDISNLSPECKIASVNLSCGYYKAHTTDEYVIWEDMENTICVVKKLLSTESKQYEYVESYYGRYGYYSYYGRDKYYDDYYYDDYYKKNKTIILYAEVLLDGALKNVVATGNSIKECWGDLFTEYANLCFNDILDYEFDIN